MYTKEQIDIVLSVGLSAQGFLQERRFVPNRKPVKPEKPENSTEVIQSIARLKKHFDVLQYLSASEYLKHLYAALKEEQHPYSYRQFASDLGFGHTNYLHLICTQARVLSTKAATTIAAHLAFSERERQYFLTLAQYQNAKRSSERERLFEQLVELKSKSMANTLGRDRLEYFSEWYHPVVRELVMLPDFAPDPDWISGRLMPRITPDQAARSLSLLIRLDAITFNEQTQRYEQTQARVSTPPGAEGLALIRYHQKMIDLGKESITRVKSVRRDVSALTMTVNESLAEEIKSDIQKFKKMILDKTEQAAIAQQGEHVYQLNIQLFPFTEVKKK